MEWLPGTDYQYWAFGLVAHAATGCPTTFGWVLAGLLALIAAGWALARRGPSPSATFVTMAALATALAWVLRDQSYLLGDSRVWIQNAMVAGRHLPADRAPLSAAFLGLTAELGRGLVATQAILALWSVVCGAGAAYVIWRAAREDGSRERSRNAAVAAVLVVFCTPLGFNFLGHIEAYPLFMFLMACFLAVFKRDLARGASYVPSLTLLLVMILFHYAAALLVVPVAAGFVGRAYPGRRLATVYVMLLAAAFVVFAAIPPLREHTLLVRTGGASALFDYAWDLLNMWLLLFVPLGIIALRTAKHVVIDQFGRTLLLVVITFAAFPLFADFELGGYRDLDLMGPAALALGFFSVVGLAGAGDARRFPLGWLILGTIFLAGLQTMTLCPEGATEMERHLERNVMESGARANAEEILAYFHWEQDDLVEANRHMEKAVAAMPGNRRQWGPLGEIQLARGDTAAAVESLRMALESHRAGRTAPLLGEVLTYQGRPREAIDVLLSVRDDVLLTRRGSAALAVAYYEAGLPESTLAVAEARLDIDPEDDVAYYNGASALAWLGDLDGAIHALTMAARLDPANLRYHRAMVRLLLTLPDGANRAREYLLSLDPLVADSLRSGF